MLVIHHNQDNVALHQVMNGCLLRAFDLHGNLGLTGALWIVPGTFDCFA